MRLTLGMAPEDEQEPMAAVDLGEPKHDHFDQGDLALTGGNLYIYLDGKEVGSLWFHVDGDGVPRAMLGQFDPELQMWEMRNDIAHLTDETTEEGK